MGGTGNRAEGRDGPDAAVKEVAEGRRDLGRSERARHLGARGDQIHSAIGEIDIRGAELPGKWCRAGRDGVRADLKVLRKGARSGEARVHTEEFSFSGVSSWRIARRDTYKSLKFPTFAIVY